MAIPTRTKEIELLQLVAELERFYTEEELDEIEETDPDRAYELARAQALAEQYGLEPGQQPATDEDLTIDHERVKAALEEAAQLLRGDGGDLELVDIDGSRVRVRMLGACSGCPSSTMDLKTIVERKVKQRVPGISEVVNTI
ncbi:NifU family protein [Thiohalorhabdus denitrificans]|uniref:Fe-S cluster biogenesis protein NfuA, 4Fe-4S-binding domain n=1 Tax=Thiohalorhabdus denitrificans TaxID=381306 RepID=A0A1G5AG08_9GAMM|nr:NifU family protein [Thiohalorhabdus denitrificans]SCX76794.1 Fe-S cluster biogenesis protein NfuA, 4Fe-4S-binding domain [Thiohalorhabdus denitrificans]